MAFRIFHGHLGLGTNIVTVQSASFLHIELRTAILLLMILILMILMILMILKMFMIIITRILATALVVLSRPAPEDDSDSEGHLD